MDGNVDQPVEVWPEEAILVAVSPSPNSEYLVRWTKRLSASHDTRWIALHVDTGAPLRREDAEALQRNLELARRLGADVVSIPSDEVVRTIVRFARTRNVSQIIIGKSGTRPTGPLPRRKTLTERIIEKSGDIDVLVVQEKGPDHSPRSRLTERLRRAAVLRLLACIAVILGVTALNLAALPVIGYTSVAIIYLLVITGLVFLFGRMAAFIAPVASALLWNFLFIPPRLTFSIQRLEDVLMFGMFFVTASTTGLLTSRLKAKEHALAMREEKMSLLYSFLQGLSEKQTISGMAETSLASLDRYFAARTILFLKADDGTLSAQPLTLQGTRITAAEHAAAAWCFEHQAPAGAYTATPVGSAFHFIPLVSPDSIVGVLGIRPEEGRAWTQDQEGFLLTLGRNLSLSLERERLARQHQRDLVNAESERLGKVLLNTVSHDLRTPLTTIKGSITALMDPAADDDPASRRELLAETLAASDKLNRIVENLLSMSRLESGVLRLKRTWVDVDDLIGTALESMRKELAEHPVEIAREEALPSVRVDFVLLLQAFTNILQNAVNHTPAGTPIRVTAGIRFGGLAIGICDSGPGVGAGELPHLFDKFFRGSRATHSGSGLGLAICKGIVEAHGGRISASGSPGRGLCVQILLPECLEAAS